MASACKRGGARPKIRAPPRIASREVSGRSPRAVNVNNNQDFPRQQTGTLGRKINLVANYFKVDLPRGSVFHYDVDIRAVKKNEKSGNGKDNEVSRLGVAKPEGMARKLPKPLCRDVMEQMFQKYKIKDTHWPAYDGNKNLYTRKRLPIEGVTKFEVTLPKIQGDLDSQEVFQVTVKPAARRETDDCEVSLEPLHHMTMGSALTYPEETVLALDIILRYGPSLKTVPVGRSFFMKPRSPDEVVMEEGRSIWFGYHQSLRPGWKPLPSGFVTSFYLNIDTAARAFLRPLNLIDFTREVLGLRELPPVLNKNNVDKLNKSLKDVQIQVSHLPYPRKYRIVKILLDKANHKMIEVDNRRITVEKYFMDKYSRKLNYANYPCVQVGNPQKNNFLPMELCQISEKQPSPGKLTPRQADKMIGETALPPQSRFKEIKRFLGKSLQDNKEILREFGINVSEEPVQFQGRILQPPALEYRDDEVRVRDGQWNMTGKHFVKACTITKWVILSLCQTRSREMYEFAKKLSEIAANAGMHFGALCAEPGEHLRTHPGMVGDILSGYKKNFPDLQVAVVIVQKPSILYKEVKQESETNLGLITQCIADITVRKCLDRNRNFGNSCLMKICQKINAKLGGINSSLKTYDGGPYILEILKKPVMIVGADVTHPSPGVNNGYSIAACVGSMDFYPAKYVAKHMIQKVNRESYAREERILELNVLIKDLLLEFYKHTGQKPERIVFFRDGVSEGQFLQVRNYELMKIREACTSVETSYEPKITFIVVQKHHNTRFAPQNFKDGLAKYNYNVPPGTVVDTEITHPSWFNFYLVSHAALKGTARPLHYNVLWDDNDYFDANTVHKFAFYLCHTYNKCTSSVSVPPPVMYANLAAYRAKMYVDNMNEKLRVSSNRSAIRVEDLLQKYVEAIVTKDAVKNEMYYI